MGSFCSSWSDSSANWTCFCYNWVDRGDPTHRVTLVKDELVVVGDYGFIFTDLELDSNPEVGDGYLGISVDVYSIDEQENEFLGSVYPGTTRFDN